MTYLAITDSDPELFDPSILPKNVLEAVEADSFWCLSRLLDGIQDNYIFAQPGIQRSVRRMAELVARIDGLLYPPAQCNTSTDLPKKKPAPLSSHLESQNVEFMQFAFRWMNCLLMREISVQNTIRMWDTYLVSVLSLSNTTILLTIISTGGRPRCFFPVSPLRLFCISRTLERKVATNGLSGKLLSFYLYHY